MRYLYFKIYQNAFGGRAPTASAGARELEAPPGVPLPLGDGSGDGAVPLPRKFLNFLHKNGVFWCTLEHGF